MPSSDLCVCGRETVQTKQGNVFCPGCSNRPGQCLCDVLPEAREEVEAILRGAVPHLDVSEILRVQPEPQPSDPIGDMQRAMATINRARTLALPLDGARLHVGQDVFDGIKKHVGAPSFSVVPMAFGGIPVVVEADRAGLIELRWTISG